MSGVFNLFELRDVHNNKHKVEIDSDETSSNKCSVEKIEFIILYNLLTKLSTITKMSPVFRLISNVNFDNQLDETASIIPPNFNASQNIVNEIHHGNFIWPENPADEMPVK